MRTATEEDLSWILQAILDFGLILEPEAIVNDVDNATGNSASTVFYNVPHLLCYWHIQENVQKHHEGTFHYRGRS